MAAVTGSTIVGTVRLELFAQVEGVETQGHLGTCELPIRLTKVPSLDPAPAVRVQLELSKADLADALRELAAAIDADAQRD
ncbi:hypothetical protein [Leifsonia aquatica]|uniref:hypothetical protein n=1 Tax=Leifsonia aquatica TaxID=144185 RepID=UPI000468C341|nr:hypothetical protein [Leifsonia aquatica]